MALATELNKGLGLSHGKTAPVPVLEAALGLQVSRGDRAQAFQRAARKAEPMYEELVQQIRGSPSVTPDETGRRVGGRLWWMWASSSDSLTVYSIHQRRGYEQATSISVRTSAGFYAGWMGRR